ncbi:helix-turn-helix domain-containing protein [Polyangium jinanense]|uniref:Helix-turn-helix domain-containing protein n=1 Tax=Polyangium jinanense TaxID=2829994 RepID=A0A9X3XI97_9BACT|nr:helix-turn-helix domain-containing protein [Polyangium jinanense]
MLAQLVRHSDASGRCWMSARTIAAKVGVYNTRTVRAAVDELVKSGWLDATPMTWAQLAAEQRAAGRPVPRRGDVGQAPNLYTVRDGRGGPVTSEGRTPPTTTGPGIVRIAPVAQGSTRTDVHMDIRTQAMVPLARADEPLERAASTSPRKVPEGGQGPKSPRDQGPKSPGGPRAEEPHDLDPVESMSRMESGGREARPWQSTHGSKEVRGEDRGWVKTWEVLATAHAEQTKHVYGLPPLPPDLKREQREAMAECLDGAAVEVCAKLRARGLERDRTELCRELAAQVMKLYFKRKTSHLVQTSHALRDLPRELHARMTEAMAALLRKSHDATQPRRPRPEPTAPKAPVEQARAAATVTQLCMAFAPPGQQRRVDRHELEAGLGLAPLEDAGSPTQDEPEPVPVEPEQPQIVASPPAPPPPLEAPREAGPQAAPCGPPPEFRGWSPHRSASPRVTAALEQLRAALGPELVPEPEVPAEAEALAVTQRPLGRAGAPRWGAVGPRPAKVRHALPQLEELEEGQGGGATPME